MVQPSTETVTLASQVVESFVSNGLPPSVARLYSHHTRLRENQSGLRTWSQMEANSHLHDVMRLLEVSSVQRQTEDDQWQKTVLRAGEILEWLPISDTNSEELSTRLLAAACYQLAGYPARASGLLGQDGSQDNESRILIALLKADFVGLLEQIATYWARTIPEIQGTSLSDSQNADVIEEAIVRETVSALGLLCAVMRWGEDSRIQKALDKLTAVSKIVLHGRNPYSWILSKLCAEVAATYVENSMRRHLNILLQNMSSDGSNVFERYLRYGFLSGKSMAWPSQVRGVQMLSGQESFALCTPTGSGKTTVAELAILQSLFPNSDNRQTSGVAPLVIYLVPSRALATEVEVKLARVLHRSTSSQKVTVTGLYGGTDWGPTDAWLTTDEKTVLICTYEKAEALMKFLGNLFLPRTTLVVIDEAHTVQLSGGIELLQKSENRSLRLESLGARLFRSLDRNRCRIVALSAVAAEAEGALAKWISHQDDATPIKTFYKSTRQLIGRLECLASRRFEIRYDLLDNAPLQFSWQEKAESPYVPNPFPPHPPASKFDGKNFTTAVRPYLLWAAMHLAAPDDRGQQRSVLISISEKIKDYAKDFLELLDRTWANNTQIPQFFQVPSDEKRIAIWNKCLESCKDYYTIDSREYRLLMKGIVVHHGKMPGLMARLLIEAIDEKIVHLVMATSTLSEGVNLPFETVLIPSLQRWNGEMNPREFKNLAGRAGRPGFGTEGRSLVLVPALPEGVQSRSEDGRKKVKIRNLYDRLVRKLQEPPIDTSDTAISPLARLIEHLRDKWRELVVDGSNAEFLIWLEQTAPIDRQGSTEPEESAIESLDSLDNVLLAAIVEIEQLSAGDMQPNELEASLRNLWQQTYAYYANQQQAELQELFIHRGKALQSTIYPSHFQRKRLYKTSLPPRSGNQLLILYPRIKQHLETGADYLSRSDEGRLTYIQDAIRLIGEVKSFSIENLKGKGKGAATNWEVILSWWLRHQRATQQPPETQISDWHNLISKNFTYRFNWGLGSIIALASDEAFGDPLEPFSLENWSQIGLPWIVFWMKELIVWGTLDPVAAYLLARVDDVTTRTQAEELSQGYYQSFNTLDPNDRLNPVTIKNWAQQSFAPTLATTTRLRPNRQISVSLLRDFSRASKQKWRVIPVEIGKEIHWLDPAGFPLASCQKPESWQAEYLSEYDFELNSNDRVIRSSVYL